MRSLLLGLGALASASAAHATIDDPVSCQGVMQPGGLLVCELPPGATLHVDGRKIEVGESGLAYIGFDRDDVGPQSGITYTIGQPDEAGFLRPIFIPVTLPEREWDVSRIDGLPKNMVSEYTEEELARIRRASARKKVGFASNVAETGFRDGFISPIPSGYTKTTNFGAQRILNGEPKRPHFGVDLAAPTGTPIVAPADGIVSLADEDMYFEGSLVMIDHGQGLISYYLHMEDVLVEDGQRVEQGEQIATVGSRGRSTGPHLCWRLKWHGHNLDPELLLDFPARKTPQDICGADSCNG